MLCSTPCLFNAPLLNATPWDCGCVVQVAGCVKNLAVVWYGVVVHGEVVSPLQVGTHTLHTHMRGTHTALTRASHSS